MKFTILVNVNHYLQKVCNISIYTLISFSLLFSNCSKFKNELLFHTKKDLSPTPRYNINCTAWQKGGPFIGLCGNKYSFVALASYNKFNTENNLAGGNEFIIDEILTEKTSLNQNIQTRTAINITCELEEKYNHGQQVLIFAYEYEGEHCISSDKSIIKIDNETDSAYQSIIKYIKNDQNPISLAADFELWTNLGYGDELESILHCHKNKRMNTIKLNGASITHFGNEHQPQLISKVGSQFIFILFVDFAKLNQEQKQLAFEISQCVEEKMENEDKNQVLHLRKTSMYNIFRSIVKSGLSTLTKSSAETKAGHIKAIELMVFCLIDTKTNYANILNVGENYISSIPPFYSLGTDAERRPFDVLMEDDFDSLLKIKNCNLAVKDISEITVGSSQLDIKLDVNKLTLLTELFENNLDSNNLDITAIHITL